MDEEDDGEGCMGQEVMFLTCFLQWGIIFFGYYFLHSAVRSFLPEQNKTPKLGHGSADASFIDAAMFLSQNE